MNRRQFTTSLGALAGAAAMPFPIARAATVAAPAIPPTAYAWANLIVRAQSKASPAMLARHLQLAPDVAQALFETLIRDGVLRAPSAMGIAKAAQPLQTTGHSATKAKAIHKKASIFLDRAKPNDPLVKDDDPALGCARNVDEVDTNACPPEQIQESPEIG